MIVVLPSAKYVPESLWQFGKLPPIIYPLGQQTVFDHLFEQYEKTADEFRVICYEGKREVRERLEEHHERVTLIELPALSSLADSVTEGIKNIAQGERICLNFADTLVMDNKDALPPDSFFYAPDFQTDQWTYFENENGFFTEIIDKEAPEEGIAEIKKLFVGVFYFSDAGYLKECMQNPPEDEAERVSSFYRALKKYAKKHPMTPVLAEKWFDIGHAEKYFNTRLEVDARIFNEIRVDKRRGILTKKSENKRKLCDEIEWYVKLPRDLEYIRPRIYDYSANPEDPFVKMEYYAYHTVHELFLYGDLSYSQWRDVFERIRFLCEDMQRYRLDHEEGIRDALEDMYLQKTKNRLRMLKEKDPFSSFFTYPICINNTLFQPLQTVEAIIEEEVQKRLLKRDDLTIIHGDLCFANILIDPNYSFIKVIDPRGSFGQYDLYGDPRYELAKLLHSVEGKYDFIIKDLYHCQCDRDEDGQVSIHYQFHDHEKKGAAARSMFFSVFQDMIEKELDEIRLIEALLFLTMIPLHEENIHQQYVMLGTGLCLLNQVCNIELQRK